MTDYEDHYTLRWYRDQGLGQVATDAVQALETEVGHWPIAVWICETEQEANDRWWRLFKEYQVNAMTYHPRIRAKKE